MFFFFPVRDEYGVKRFPGMVLAIILVNCLVYFVFGFRGPEYNAIVKKYGFTPSVFAPGTLLTSMFLHGGLLHLGFNMWYLWLLGDNLEDRWGHGRFLIFYLGAGVFASVLYSVMIPARYAGVPTIGASGAIAGVLGAYAVLFPKSRITFKYLILFIFLRVGEFELYAGFWLALWFLQQALSSLLVAREMARSSVAFAAHLSGFLFGAVVASGVRLFQEARRYALVAEGRHALEQLLGGPKTAALTFEQEASLKSRSDELIALMEDDRVAAGELYEKLLREDPQLTLPERWQYQLAESLERQGKKQAAAAACQNFMRRYPYSKLADNILFFLGKHFLNEGDYEKAKNALRQVVLFYPYSD
ncbi:MAG TPA: rhomboid family intramembrane serine protease, partial [bacterium]|nr:rhomboid family intramembrane serine protease [bacterium]